MIILVRNVNEYGLLADMILIFNQSKSCLQINASLQVWGGTEHNIDIYFRDVINIYLLKIINLLICDLALLQRHNGILMNTSLLFPWQIS